MSDYRHRRMGAWLLIAIVVALVAAHAVVLYYVSSHIALSAGVVVGVVVLVLLKHLGLLGTAYAAFRRRYGNGRK